MWAHPGAGGALEQEATVQALCAAFPELEASLVHILYREHGECDELMQQLQLLCGGAAGEASARTEASMAREEEEELRLALQQSARTSQQEAAHRRASPAPVHASDASSPAVRPPRPVPVCAPCWPPLAPNPGGPSAPAPPAGAAGRPRAYKPPPRGAGWTPARRVGPGVAPPRTPRAPHGVTGGPSRCWFAAWRADGQVVPTPCVLLGQTAPSAAPPRQPHPLPSPQEPAVRHHDAPLMAAQAASMAPSEAVPVSAVAAADLTWDAAAAAAWEGGTPEPCEGCEDGHSAQGLHAAWDREGEGQAESCEEASAFLRALFPALMLDVKAVVAAFGVEEATRICFDASAAARATSELDTDAALAAALAMGGSHSSDGAGAGYSSFAEEAQAVWAQQGGSDSQQWSCGTAGHLDGATSLDEKLALLTHALPALHIKEAAAALERHGGDADAALFALVAASEASPAAHATEEHRHRRMSAQMATALAASDRGGVHVAPVARGGPVELPGNRPRSSVGGGGATSRGVPPATRAGAAFLDALGAAAAAAPPPAQGGRSVSSGGGCGAVSAAPQGPLVRRSREPASLPRENSYDALRSEQRARFAQAASERRLAQEAFAAGDKTAAWRHNRLAREAFDAGAEAAAAARETTLAQRNVNIENTYTRELHGLHVNEALAEVARWVDIFSTQHSGGEMKLNFITGRGAHSADGAKIQPAVCEYLTARGIPFSLPPYAKGGVVHVVLDDSTRAAALRTVRQV